MNTERKTGSRGLVFLPFFTVIFCALLIAQEKDNAEFKLAVGLYNDGMYDLAIEQFKNFITVYPATSQSVEARYYLGLSQMKLKRYDEARITFQNFALAYVDHPKAAEAWINVGEAFLGLNNEREAASAYERVKVFNPKSPLAPEALLKAAQLYRRIGERESAKKALRTIIQDYPTSKSVLPARLAIGELYSEEGQTELAESEARRVSESDAPGSVKASALFSIGKLQAAASLFDDAETTFKTVTTIYKNTPASSAATFELGKLAKGKGDYLSAIEYLKKVASDKTVDDSVQAQALFEIGSSYTAQHDYANAQQSFEELYKNFQKNPLSGRVLLEAGRSALANGKTKEALKHLQKVLSLPSSPFKRLALVLAAQASISANNYNEAAARYTTYFNEYPDDPYTPDMMVKLARMYTDQLQDYRKAMMVYDQIAQKFSGSPKVIDALLGIGLCEEKIGDDEGALRTYLELQRRYPANDVGDTLLQRIDFLRNHKIKNRDAGIEKLARLIGEVVTQKSKAELSFQLGQIYFNDLKDYPSAAQQFSTAIESGLDADRFIDAYYFRARAYHLQSDIDPAAIDQAILYYTAFLKQYPSSKWSDDAAFFNYRLKSNTAPPTSTISLAQDFLNNHPTSSHRDKVLLDLGNATLSSGHYAEALNAFKTMILEFSQSSLIPEALLLQGSAYQQIGNTDSAAISWRQAASMTSTNRSTALAVWKLADLYWHNKNFEEAITLWKRIQTEFFYSSLVQKTADLLPQAYFATGEYDEAISLYEHFLELQQDSPFGETPDATIFLYLAEAYSKKGNRQQALHYYNEYLLYDRSSPNASKAFYALGVLARDRGKAAEASTYFKQAAALGGSAAASSDIADLLFQSEQYAAAAQQYTRLAQSADSLSDRQRYWSKVIVSTLRMDKLAEAQKLMTDFEETYSKNKNYQAEFEYEKGNYYFRRQDYINAKKTFEKVAEDFDETHFGPWGEYYLGKILEVNNNLDDAAKKYENIFKKYPDSDVLPRVLLSLGNMNFNVERFEDAIRYYQRITDQPDKSGDILPYAMNNLIEAYESTKLYDAALKMTRDFIERYPNDESFIDKKIKIGTFYTRLGYYDQAVLHFQNLLNEAGSLLEAEIRYNIGEAYYYKGDYQQAVLEFLKVPYLVSKQGKVNWTATSFYMAGQAYEKMSKFDEALGMYQQIVERSGIDATFKAAARKEIDRVKLIIKKGSK